MFVPDYQGYSTEELNEALSSIDKDKYPENYERLIAELNNRKSKGEDISPKKADDGFEGSLTDKNITNNPQDPHLYSRRAIVLFALIFSTLFGGILMAINFFKVKKLKEMSLTLIFSVLYTLLTIYIVSFFNMKILITVSLNGVGAAILEEYFWKRKLGKEFKYRRDPIWIPLVIAILVNALILISMIYQQPD